MVSIDIPGLSTQLLRPLLQGSAGLFEFADIPEAAAAAAADPAAEAADAAAADAAPAGRAFFRCAHDVLQAKYGIAISTVTRKD